jgi:preprotein translocase subunit SecD
MRGRDLRILAGILDGEVVLAQELHAPIHRKEHISAWLMASEAEDLVALIRGGELPVKLDPKSLSERTVAPRR